MRRSGNCDGVLLLQGDGHSDGAHQGETVTNSPSSFIIIIIIIIIIISCFSCSAECKMN